MSELSIEYISYGLLIYQELPIMQNAIKYARYRPGSTNTAGGLRTAQEISVSTLGDRSEAENIIFLITDGASNVNEEDTLPAADDLKASGARIVTIGVNMQDTSEIERMASAETDVFRLKSFNGMHTIVEYVIRTTCRNGNES